MGCFVIHSFLFRMPLARAVSLRKIVTGFDNRHADIHTTHPLTHKFTDAASLHRARIAGPRERGHWARLGAQTLRGTAGSGRSRRADGVSVRRGGPGSRACSTSAAAQVTHGRNAVRCGAGRALARASADTRQPPSQWRSGRVRARALRRSLRISPIGSEIWRRRGEQTRHASPSNTVTRLKRI